MAIRTISLLEQIKKDDISILSNLIFEVSYKEQDNITSRSINFLTILNYIKEKIQSSLSTDLLSNDNIWTGTNTFNKVTDISAQNSLWS